MNLRSYRGIFVQSVAVYVQFPVHICIPISLRVSNSHLFESGSTDENSWGFGQIIAVGLILVTVVQGIQGYIGTDLLALSIYEMKLALI